MKPIYCEVPQDLILGPLLFIIYMNALSAAVPDISIIMYADDTETGRSFTSVTEFMIFCTNNRLNQLEKSPVTTPYTLCFYNFEVTRVKHTNYLGLIVNDTLT